MGLVGSHARYYSTVSENSKRPVRFLFCLYLVACKHRVPDFGFFLAIALHFSLMFTSVGRSRLFTSTGTTYAYILETRPGHATCSSNAALRVL